MQYENDHLVNVVYELRFDPILFLKQHPPEDFQQAFGERLPRVREGVELGVAARVTADTTLDASIQDQNRVWSFLSADRNVTVTISANVFRLEYLDYPGFESMREDFAAFWERFRRECQVKLLARAGLRYINKISIPEGDPLDWGGYVHGDVIAATIGVESPENMDLARSMHQIHWTADDHRITLRFGLANDDFPNAIAKREFILDLDCFTVGEREADEALAILDQFHGCIEVLFETTIEERLREEMGILVDDRA